MDILSSVTLWFFGVGAARDRTESQRSKGSRCDLRNLALPDGADQSFLEVCNLVGGLCRILRTTFVFAVGAGKNGNILERKAPAQGG